MMIRLDGELKEWRILREEEDGRVLLKAGAGLLLSKIGRAALEEGLTGFEFAAGIPGTLGGAAVMNAGAYGGEMKDILVSVRVMTPDGQVEELPGRRASVVLPPQLHSRERICGFIGCDGAEKGK